MVDGIKNNHKIMLNKNAGYGLAQLSSLPQTTGKVFVVTATTGANFQDIIKLYTPDYVGVPRNMTTITSALDQCVAGRGDVIVCAPDFITAPTDAELEIADTKGVRIVGAEQSVVSRYIATRPATTLPATTTKDIFRVLGNVKIVDIIGVVTTVIQTQNCNLKISTYHGTTSTDICADLNISADAVGSRMSITGTFANALINTAAGVPLAPQATAIVVQKDSTLRLTTSATNTGAIRWVVVYEPLDIGARIVAI